MKDWRRRFASWPLEKPVPVDVARSPGWPDDPERRDRVRRLLRRFMGATMLGFLVPTLATLGTMAYLAAEEEVGWAAGAGLGGLVVTVGVFLAVVGRAAARFGLRLRHWELERLEARGEITVGGEFVGVSYADRLWRHPTMGFDMDRGVLRLDYDRLTFVGQRSRFELPPDAVQSIEVRRFEFGLNSALPRLYVTWLDRGRPQTFSLSLPAQPTLRRRVADAVDLQARIEEWRAQRRPRLAFRPCLAPPTDVVLTKGTAGLARSGTLAKLLAALATIPLGFGIAVGFVLLFKSLDWSFGPFAAIPTAFAVALWLTLAPLIERRLPERYRHPEDSAVPEAQTFADPREDEAAVHPNA